MSIHIQSDVTIRLEPASTRSVVVRNQTGVPLAGAAVIDFSGSTLTGVRLRHTPFTPLQHPTRK